MPQDPIHHLGHELRNILSPAMMLAERMCGHTDPAVQRAGNIILESLDKAIAAIRAANAG